MRVAHVLRRVLARSPAPVLELSGGQPVQSILHVTGYGLNAVVVEDRLRCLVVSDGAHQPRPPRDDHDAQHDEGDKDEGPFNSLWIHGSILHLVKRYGCDLRGPLNRHRKDLHTERAACMRCDYACQSCVAASLLTAACRHLLCPD